ncbi:MAG: uroporphyrinogen decarboxylase [Saprospiraceae bacterium]|nr:uroporphyrinogen decarboxylase [Saprospiraceae bacterium]
MAQTTYKNDLILRALNGETVERPPVWMMRQAGRYLPEYMVLRKKYDFFTRIQTPDLAAEITIQPIDIVGVDAAILFSDILTVPKALGLDVQMVPGKGPWIPDHIQSPADLARLTESGAVADMQYVYDAIKATVKALDNRVPLLGFAGSPWTILCYMVEGQGSKNFAKAKGFCFEHPKAAHQLLQAITNVTIGYLNEQIKAGVAAVQIFDSWGGLLGPVDYQAYSMNYIQQIIDEVEGAPVIVFGKGCWFAYDSYTNSGAQAIGVDWTIAPKTARELAGDKITLQGNFDPIRLLSPIPEIERLTKEMIDGFGKDRFIANLGHGIIPNIPVPHAKAFVDAVKNYKA